MNLDGLEFDGTIKSKELSNGRIVTYMVPKQVKPDPFKSFDCKANIEIVAEFSDTETVKVVK